MQFTEYYSDILKQRPQRLRGRVRRIALAGFALIDHLQGIDDILSKPRIQFIYLHHLFKDEEEKLKTLLQNLQRHHTFISYSDAVSKVLNAKIDKPYICFSLDDGFRNNLQAATILDAFGAKACIFINPGLVGETDILRIADHCKRRLHFPPVEFLNWNEINQLQRMGHEIGSHTMHHMNIGQTDLREVEEDMNTTFETITRHCGSVKHFAFPYGRFQHFTDAARKVCFRTGYVSCATAERGCHVNHGRTMTPQELYIRRDHVILNWNISHVLHFLVRNARNAHHNGNLYPGNWESK